jgi:hypothetical protein
MRLIIISLITTTTRIIIGIRRCHFPLAGAEGIMEAAGAVAGMEEAGMAVDMAEAGTVAVGMAVDMAEAGTVAVGMAAAEKFVSDGGQIHLFEPLEPRFDPGLAGRVNCVCSCSIFPPSPFFERRQRTAGMQDACKLAQCVPHWPFSAPDRARGSRYHRRWAQQHPTGGQSGKTYP